MPTCHSLDEGPKMPHALGPADELLQQPLVSTLPVQQFCCHRVQSVASVGCMQQQPPQSPPDPTSTPPSPLTQAAGGQQCCETSKLH